MIITDNNLTKIEKIEAEEGLSSGMLLTLILAASTEKKTTVKTIVGKYGVSESQRCVEILLREDMLTKKDFMLIDSCLVEPVRKTKLSQNSMEESKSFRVLSHLKKLNPSVSVKSKKNHSLVNLLLKKGFSEDDLKQVNYYFYHLWKDLPDMSPYITPDTLYNTKFEARLSQAKPVLEKIKLFYADIKQIVRKFAPLVLMELPPEKRVANSVSMQDVPFSIQKGVSYWRSMGYSIDSIEGTVKYVVEKSSKKKRGQIFLSSILGDNFLKYSREAESLLVLSGGDENGEIDAWSSE